MYSLFISATNGSDTILKNKYVDILKIGKIFNKLLNILVSSILFAFTAVEFQKKFIAIEIPATMLAIDKDKLYSPRVAKSEYFFIKIALRLCIKTNEYAFGNRYADMPIILLKISILKFILSLIDLDKTLKLYKLTGIVIAAMHIGMIKGFAIFVKTNINIISKNDPYSVSKLTKTRWVVF